MPSSCVNTLLYDKFSFDSERRWVSSEYSPADQHNNLSIGGVQARQVFFAHPVEVCLLCLWETSVNKKPDR